MENRILHNITSDDIKAMYTLLGFFIVLVFAGEFVSLPHTISRNSLGAQVAYSDESLKSKEILHSSSTVSPVSGNLPNTHEATQIDSITTALDTAKSEKVEHITTPEPLRALYMTKWIASMPKLREKLVKKIDDSPVLNAIIIDIKDDTGRISFDLPVTTKIEKGGSGASMNTIRDIDTFLKDLHKRNIYVIGRVSVFQDKYYAKLHPEDALQDEKGNLWGDRKDQRWMDQTTKSYWEYIAKIGEQSYNKGFDEINFDYIRFATDGKMDAIVYPHYDKKTPKYKVIEEFYAYLHDYFKPKKIPISGDLFGLTTEAEDDMGIGQKLEYALTYFDYVGPMIYPSHYAKGYHGIKEPAKNPYKVIRAAMEGAIIKADFNPELIKKLRPWVQDFDLGGNYQAKEIHDQIRAMAELGVDSYMVWDPNNKYSPGAYDDEVQFILRDFKKPVKKVIVENTKSENPTTKVKKKQ